MDTQNENASASSRSEHTGVMSIMGREGDTKHYWNARNQAEVDVAREVFTEHRSRGYLAFAMNRNRGNETQGEQMHEFDPAAGSILFIPQMQGG